MCIGMHEDAQVCRGIRECAWGCMSTHNDARGCTMRLTLARTRVHKHALGYASVHNDAQVCTGVDEEPCACGCARMHKRTRVLNEAAQGLQMGWREDAKGK